MKNRGVIVVAAIVVASGAYLAWDLRSEKSETESKAQQTLLFPFNPDQVNEFVIENGKGKTRLVRSVDGWKIEEPLSDLADDGFTDDFVDRSLKDHFLEVAKEGEGIDWKVYGLDQPVGKVTFKTQAGVSRTVEISPKQNFEQNSIVRFAGENRVLIVPASWSVNAGRGNLDFRDKRLLRRKIGGVDQLELTNANGSFSLAQKDGKWTVPAQPNWTLDQNRVRELLSMINETKATDFLSAEDATNKKALEALGLSKPVVTIRLVVKDQPWSASFGRGGAEKEKNDYALLGEAPGLLKLEPASIAKFETVSMDGLRDKKAPFDFAKGIVKKIDVETPLKKASFLKEGAVWTVKDGADGVEADSGKIDELIDRMRNSQAARFADAEAAAKYKPINKVSFSDGEKEIFSASWSLPFKAKLGEASATVEKNNATVVASNNATVVAMKTNKSEDVFLVEDATMSLFPLQSLVKTKGAPAAEAKPKDAAETKVNE